MDSYPTAISADLIKLEELDGLVQSLSKMFGATAKVSVQFLVETDNSTLADIFENLEYHLHSRKPAKVEDKVRKRAKRGKKSARNASPKEKGEAGPNSFIDSRTGEVISARALNVKLAAGEVDDNTVFEKADGRRFVAFEGKLIKEPQS